MKHQLNREDLLYRIKVSVSSEFSIPINAPKHVYIHKNGIYEFLSVIANADDLDENWPVIVDLELVHHANYKEFSNEKDEIKKSQYKIYIPAEYIISLERV